MHRAAAATIPMTIPVVLLDSRTTSEGPGLTPGSVGSAVGILRNTGEVNHGGPLAGCRLPRRMWAMEATLGLAERLFFLAIHFASRIMFGGCIVKGGGKGRGGGGAALAVCGMAVVIVLLRLETEALLCLTVLGE